MTMSVKAESQKTSGGPQECAGCGKKIQDRFLLKALDMYWHEDCLKCGCCDCRLGEVGSTLYTKGNLILCKRDYLRLFGTTGYCSACNKVIPAFEMVMRARTNVYHLECFACQQCNHRFCVGDRFFLCDNKILCEYDYEERMVFANLAYSTPNFAHIKQHQQQQQQQQQITPQSTRTGKEPPPPPPLPPQMMLNGGSPGGLQQQPLQNGMNMGGGPSSSAGPCGSPYLNGMMINGANHIPTHPGTQGQLHPHPHHHHPNHHHQQQPHYTHQMGMNAAVPTNAVGSGSSSSSIGANQHQQQIPTSAHTSSSPPSTITSSSTSSGSSSALSASASFSALPGAASTVTT